VISFTKEELKGVPSDVVSGYTKRPVAGSEDVYDVTFKTPDIFPIFKYAENPDVRKRTLEAYESRLDINIPLFDKMLDLRRQISKLLGYETWADYKTEVKMVKNAKNVVDVSSQNQCMFRKC
jgi:Zn-dependent oligopeptidase